MKETRLLFIAIGIVAIVVWALRGQRAARLLEARILFVLARGPATAIAVADELHAPHHEVWYRMRRLELRGVLIATTDGVLHPERGMRPRYVYHLASLDSPADGA